MHAGVHIGEIGRAVQNTAEEAGFSVVRKYTGHGIGQQMHEPPQVPNFVGTWSRHGPKLPAGATVAIEPMVNAGTYKVRELNDGWTVVTSDGKLSAHFEHTVAVEAHGPVIMTAL
jgi:methionyl aminopeptidase